MSENQMSFSKWVGTLFLVSIPVVNIMLLMVWAFGEDNPRKNYSRAALVVFSSFIGIGVLFGLVVSIIGSTQTQANTNEVSNNTAIAEQYIKHQEKETKSLAEDIEVLEVSVKPDDSGKKVVVFFKNTSKKTSYSTFVIACNIYDDNDSIIQTVEITVDDTVPPGEKLKFTEWRTHVDAYKVKAIGIRNKTPIDF